MKLLSIYALKERTLRRKTHQQAEVSVWRKGGKGVATLCSACW
jgi:hypothetical protein